MKYKQKIDIIINSCLFLVGILTIILGIIKYSDIKTIFISIMFLYSILNLAQYLMTKSSKDIEGLLTFVVSLATAIVDYNLVFNSKVLCISIMVWVSLMSVIKFIKTDYYNDRKDKMWKLRIITLIVFIISGILTSLCFNYSSNVQILVLGYFFMIHSILELIDPITKYLISK